MNYFAHAFLSKGMPGILTGNMISDFVKGSTQYHFSKDIQQGIRLHRQIDSFTDTHEATGFIKNLFRPHYRLYAGAFTDVVYDFFLSNDGGIFEGEDAIESVSRITIEELEQNKMVLPISFLPVFESMKKHNWLAHFRHTWAIERSFLNLKRRALHINETETAFDIFLTRQSEMKKAYDRFFPDLEKFCSEQLSSLPPM